jgi:hypothetical protein
VSAFIFQRHAADFARGSQRRQVGGFACDMDCSGREWRLTPIPLQTVGKSAVNLKCAMDNAFAGEVHIIRITYMKRREEDKYADAFMLPGNISAHPMEGSVEIGVRLRAAQARLLKGRPDGLELSRTPAFLARGSTPLASVPDLVDEIYRHLGYVNPDDWLHHPYRNRGERIRRLYSKIDPLIRTRLDDVAEDMRVVM